MRNVVIAMLVVLLWAAAVPDARQAPFQERDMMTIGVYSYPEAWPREQWARDFANMKKYGFEFVHMAEFAWAFLEPEEGR
jgi:beta-galactosidase